MDPGIVNNGDGVDGAAVAQRLLEEMEWDRAKAALGLAGDLELTVHTCRHTLCSRLAQKGIPLPQIMAWSGHTSLASVARYMHIDITGLETAKQALEAM